MIHTDQMGQALQNIFGESADEVARETQFVQRESKLSGIKFVQTLVLGFLQHPEASLNLLCQVAADLGVEITRQGLQKRLTSAAVALMQAMFDRSQDTLQNKVPIPLTLLTQFTAVQRVDSSGISLPDSLAAEFPAAGGDGPAAGLKLQTIWEFLRGNLAAVFQTTAREPDQSFTGQMWVARPNQRKPV